MDKKCEELLDNSVIRTRYPNKKKTDYQILTLLFHSYQHPCGKLYQDFCGKMWKSLAHKKDTN